MSAGKFVWVREVVSSVKEWVFYGHVWIALAAAGLGWMTLALFSPTDIRHLGTVAADVIAFLFSATFGVYTLHRVISYRRAGVIPTTKRYALVDRYQGFSVTLGVAALSFALVTVWRYVEVLWIPGTLAFVLTAFYLIPPLPGWRRLRDVPYLKGVWVAGAWSIMTALVPVLMAQDSFTGACGGTYSEVNRWGIAAWESLNRFCFTLAIALLFDNRDVQLDAAHGVKTVAGTHPHVMRLLVPALLLISAAIAYRNARAWPGSEAFAVVLGLAYLTCLLIAFRTYGRRDEDWYAVVVNGLLLLPPAVVFFWYGFAGSPFAMFS